MPNITNPLLAGDLVDIADQTEFLLTVASTNIDLSSTSRFNLRDFFVSYDKKELVFSEIVSTVPASCTFTLDNSVTLKINFGSGLTHYFRGKIRNVEYTGINNQERIQYTAYGISVLANEVQVQYNGIPEYFLSGLVETQNEGALLTLISAKRISQALSELFSDMAAVLTAAGIPSAIGAPNTSVFSGFLPGDVSFHNTNFVDAVKQIVAYEPDKRLFFDDTTNTWIFPTLPSASIYHVHVTSVNLETNIYNIDLNNRFTSLKMIAMNAQALPTGQKAAIVLAKGWDTSLESSWTLPRGQGIDPNTDIGTHYFNVYRKWTFDGNTQGYNENMPKRLYQLVDWWGVQGWVAIDAFVDWKNRVVVSQQPLIYKGNPYVPGDAQGPLAVVLTYWPAKNMQLNWFDNITYPSSGYEGTAFTFFGVQRQRLEFVDISELFIANAKSRLALYKDVVVEGDLPLEGDPIPELINLQCRLTLVSSNGPTGIESYYGMLTEYRYEFGKRGKSTVHMSNDMSQVIRTTQ